ncbi:MAG: TIGR02757 family protein [Cyclobacteriaceae bacterium]|nr:TIGR02757 family protein [Cyclobacteriaceae bacterium]
MPHPENLKYLLEEKYLRYNQQSFIENDPISVPHRFNRRQDIEIAGLFAAILAWGQRKTTIRKGFELMQMMDNSPYDFILHHRENDLKVLTRFKHRTFNATDTLYFVYFLNRYYRENASLEDLFLSGYPSVEKGLIHFHDLFFSLESAPARTKKHIPSPKKRSTCKRLNMYLRWMVRNDGRGVDFGLWSRISPSRLICPVDLHVDRVARKMGLISRKQTDWYTAVELTDHLKKIDPEDPVKYDYALFGLGVIENYGF